MSISTTPPEYKEETNPKGHEKGGPPKGPARWCYARLVTYRTILRATRPPATRSAPAPRASSEAPPVSGSVLEEAAEAELLEELLEEPLEAEAEELSSDEAELSSCEAAEALPSSAWTEAEAEAEAETLPPKSISPRHALIWAWLTLAEALATATLPSSAAALASPYWAATAFWTCEQSMFTVSSPMVAWAKAGAAAANTIASMAASNITFLILYLFSVLLH